MIYTAKQTLNKINGTITAHRFIIFTFFSAIVIRLVLAYLPGFKFDIDAWFAWAIRLNEVGFSQFYSAEIWTNYTPGYLYILAWLAQIKNLLSLNNENFYILLKLPPIITDIIIAILIYRTARPKLSPPIRLTLTCLALFNPFVIFNSAIWGQIDSLLTLFMLLSIIALSHNRLILSSILFAVALLIKPQALSIAIIYPLFLFRHFNLKNTTQLILPGILTLFFGSILFFINDPFFGTLGLIKQMTADYPYNSLFAYNLWGSLGYWIQDNTTLLGISYRNWGLTLLAIFYMYLSHLYLTKRLDLISLSALTTLGFYFLPTRIHERYLYPALILLIFVIIYHYSRRLITAFLILSLFHSLNLYYVYVYYNEVFPDTAHILYHAGLYNFLESANQSLSFVSFIIFTITTWLIIAANHPTKVKSSHAK